MLPATPIERKWQDITLVNMWAITALVADYQQVTEWRMEMNTLQHDTVLNDIRYRLQW